MQVVTEYMVTYFLFNIKKIFIQLLYTSVTLFFLGTYINSVVFWVLPDITHQHNAHTTYNQTTATQALNIKDKKIKGANEKKKHQGKATLRMLTDPCPSLIIRIIEGFILAAMETQTCLTANHMFSTYSYRKGYLSCVGTYTLPL